MLPPEGFVFIEKVWIPRSLLKSIFQSWWESIYNNELLKFETLFLCLDFLRFYSRIRRIEWKRNSLGRALLSYCFRHPLCYEKQIRETFGRRCEAATRILKISSSNFLLFICRDFLCAILILKFHQQKSEKQQQRRVYKWMHYSQCF